MPTSGFETALTERIEFAVFVAYEQWVRASNYAAPNPYDVLARLLTGLPEALAEAAGARGGWGAFDPVSGLPTDVGRQLIAEMAAQVVTARVAALAPHAPEANLLAQVVVDAVSRSVSVFVDDPDSWRLAMNPGERAPVAALADQGPGQAQADGDTAEPAYAVPPMPADEGGDSGGVAAAVVRAAEAGPAKSNFLQLAEFWFVKSSSTAPGNDASVAALGNLLVGGSSSLSLAEADEELAREMAKELAELRAAQPGEDGTATAVPGELGDGIPIPPHLRSEHLEAWTELPAAIQVVIAKWVKLLDEASFWRINPDGSLQRLSEQEAHEVVDTLIDVLIRRAELDIRLPPPPAAEEFQPLPEPPQAPPEPEPYLDEPPQVPPDPPFVEAGLGSGSIEIPPLRPPSDGPAYQPPIEAPRDVALATGPETEFPLPPDAEPPPGDLTLVTDLIPPITTDADPLFG